jgi:hypothetical protein
MMSSLSWVTALVAAVPPVLAATSSFATVELDAAVEIGYGVAVADVDGDGRRDVLLADRRHFYWYRNPSWEKHALAGQLTPHDHVCLAAADLDGDGRCEVAAGAGWNPGDTTGSGAVFYLQPPADRRQLWKSLPLPYEPTVHRMRWVRQADGRFDLVVVPLHGRGNDARAGTGAGVRVLAYKQPADLSAPWTTEVLDDHLHKTHNFDAVRWDADPAEELLIASQEGVFLLDRTPEGIRRQHLTGADGGGAGEVRLGRLASGRKFIATVEPMHGTNLVVYFEPTNGQARELWVRQVIATDLAEGHAVGCGDLAGLGNDQIVVGWRSRSAVQPQVGIKLFQLDSGTGGSWTSRWVDRDGIACEDLCLADLDGDGRLDVVAAGRATRNLRLYLNRSSR